MTIVKRALALHPGVQAATVIGLGVLCLVLLNLTRPEPERRAADEVAAVAEVLRAEPRPTRMTVTAYGTARARTALKIVARVAGEVVFLAPSLREGSFIRKCELLARIDPRPYRLAVERLEAQVSQGEIELERLLQERKNAEADLELAVIEVQLAERELERERELVRRGTHSEAARDRVETAWVASRKKALAIEHQLALWPGNRAAAEARLQQLRAQLEEAKLSLADSETRSPFDARSVSRLVEAGQFVTVGTVLAEIYDPGVMEVPVDVRLEDFQWIDSGPLLNGRQTTGASAALPAAEARRRVGRSLHRWPGRVARLDSRIDRQTRTVRLIVDVPGTGAAGPEGGAPPLAPGSFLEVEIEGRRIDNIVTVPRGAIDQNDRVYLSADGRLLMRRVSVLRISDAAAYIDQGLEAGDLVIVSPLSAPVEGMAVRPVQKKDEPPAGTVPAPSQEDSK